MEKNFFIPLLLGMCGVLVLVSLGFWQVHRLSWKQAILSDIDNTITAEPVELNLELITRKDQYLPVRAEGQILQEEAHVLISLKTKGAGYRLISAFETLSGKILLDQGFISLEHKNKLRVTRRVDVLGNLYWPDEIDSFTPEPDQEKKIWFARDIKRIALELNTKPILLVARSITPNNSNVMMLPISSVRIPNNHFQYAITWFSLAFVWLGMTVYLLWRIRVEKNS